MVGQHPNVEHDNQKPTSVTGGDALMSHRFIAVNTLILDVSTSSAATVADAAASAGTTVVPFRYVPSLSHEQKKKQQWMGNKTVDELKDVKDVTFFESRIHGETRALFGTALNVDLGQRVGGKEKKKVEKMQSRDSFNDISEEEEEEFEIITFRMVTPSYTLSPSAVLPPLDCRRRVLHIVGATSSPFYKGISDTFGLQGIDHLSHDSNPHSVSTDTTSSNNINYHPMSSLFTQMIAYVHVDDGTWSVSDEVTTFDVDTAPRMSTVEAIEAVARLAPDVVLPHMYDYAGMTGFKGLFEDVLQIPVIGSSSAAMALSTHKARTLAVARQAGVPVAPSVVVRRMGRGVDDSENERDIKGVYDVSGRVVKVESTGELVQKLGFDLPVMVKPAEEDNSLGIQRACTSAELTTALHAAFQYGDDVVVEQYIPLGREVRVGMVENSSGDLVMLPVLEYLFNPDSSIRTSTDKFRMDEHGNPIRQPKAPRRRLPADDSMTDTLLERLRVMATAAHKALGCRDYSIFDVRVDPDENVFMLESCLYCSFARGSVIALMASARGINPRVLFDQMVDWAMSRRRVVGMDGGAIGMKGR